MPKLSIITINRNNANGLEQTVKSVNFQIFTDFELIIIDGASKDESLEVIKKFEDKITYWVSEPDSGIYQAMNKGIAKASGEYCLFLNSGDFLTDRSTLQKVFANNWMEDIIVGNLIKKDGDKTWIDKGFGDSDITLYDLYIGTINHGSAFIRRNLFDEYGFYSEKYKVVSDWEFYVKSVGLGKASVKYVDLNISVFDMKGISNRDFDYFQTERKPALEELIPPRILADYTRFYYDLKMLDAIKSKYFPRMILKIANKLAKLRLS